MKRVSTLFFIQMILIAALALSTGYSLPTFEDSNWDTALLLTPLGIIKNFTAEDGVLRSFYADISPGQTQFSLSRLALVTAVDLAAIAAGLTFLRRRA